MKRLRLWIQSRRRDAIGELGRQLVDAERELAEMRQQLADTERDAQTFEDAHDHLGKLLRGLMNGIGFDPPDGDWMQSQAAAMHAVSSHVDAKLQEIEVRASQAERVVEDLRSALADERRQHDQTRGALNASEAENAEVWARIEKIRAQTAADIAIQARRKAIAETESRRRPEDDDAG